MLSKPGPEHVLRSWRAEVGLLSSRVFRFNFITHDTHGIHSGGPRIFLIFGGGGLKNVFPWDIFHNIADSD
jgi:hypothetical protein